MEKTPKVWISGKLVSIEEITGMYGYGIGSSERRILEILSKTKEPILTKNIATETNLSNTHIGNIMRKLVSNGYVVALKLKASVGRHYLLTEKGYNLIKQQ